MDKKVGAWKDRHEIHVNTYGKASTPLTLEEITQPPSYRVKERFQHLHSLYFKHT